MANLWDLAHMDLVGRHDDLLYLLRWLGDDLHARDAANRLLKFGSVLPGIIRWIYCGQRDFVFSKIREYLIWSVPKTPGYCIQWLSNLMKRLLVFFLFRFAASSSQWRCERLEERLDSNIYRASKLNKEMNIQLRIPSNWWPEECWWSGRCSVALEGARQRGRWGTEINILLVVKDDMIQDWHFSTFFWW